MMGIAGRLVVLIVHGVSPRTDGMLGSQYLFLTPFITWSEDGFLFCFVFKYVFHVSYSHTSHKEVLVVYRNEVVQERKSESID